MFTLSTKKSYHHGNLRQEIVAVSLDLIAEQGVRALTLREIATRLNVSRMAPYRHFADKDALLSAIAAAGFSKFAEALEAAERNAPVDFVSQADALAVAYVRFARENGAHFEVMFGGGGEPQFLDEAGKDIANKCFLILENMVQRGQEKQRILPGDPTAIAQMIWATVHGISTLGLGIERCREDWDPRFTLFCAKLLRDGLSPR